LEEEGAHISKTSLRLLLKKYRQTGSVVNRPRARAPKKLTDAHYVFIDSALEKDDELTAPKLHHLLVEKFPNLDVSNSTIKQARRELSWVSSKVYRRKRLVEYSNRWLTPAESPDCNTIENVWAGMNAFLPNEYKPHNLESLKDGIQVFWKTEVPMIH